MDDVDGALFSRVPVRDDQTDPHRLASPSQASLTTGFSYEGKYSKLDLTKEHPNLNENENETIPNLKKEIIVKRESVPVFRSMPPKNKCLENNKEGAKVPVSKTSSTASVPCELGKESSSNDELTEMCKTHYRSGSVNHSPGRHLVRISPEQQKIPVIPPNFFAANSPGSLNNDQTNSPETPAVHKNTEELQNDISEEVIFYTPENDDSSNRIGDVDSNFENDTAYNLEYYSPLKSTADHNKASETDLKPGLEEKTVETEITSNRASAVFYINEDELFIDIGERKSETDQTKLQDSEITDSTDSTVAKQHYISEPVNPESNTEKQVNAAVSENETMLKKYKNTTQQRRVVCRVILALVFPVLSLSVYIFDIGSDIRLGIAYRDQGDMNLFGITLGCIVIPLILMSLVDVSWLWLDRPPSTPRYILRYILGVLTLGRIVRSLIYMWHIVRSKTSAKEEERVWHQNRATEEKRDCFMLDFINAFAESVPQLFVQLYLMYAFDLELTVIRVLNLLSSWASIAWAYSAYYRCNREILTGKQDLNIVGFTVFFLSVLSALAARVICVVLFLVYLKPWIGSVVLTTHFIVMLFWIIFRENPRLEGTTPWKLGKYMYCIFFAYVSLLCFLNLRNTRAKYRMVAFYFLVYIENFTLAAFVFYKIYVSQTGNETLYNLLALPVGFIMHVALLVTYYQIFHPKTGMCRGCFKRTNHSLQMSNM